MENIIHTPEDQYCYKPLCVPTEHGMSDITKFKIMLRNLLITLGDKENFDPFEVERQINEILEDDEFDDYEKSSLIEQISGYNPYYYLKRIDNTKETIKELEFLQSIGLNRKNMETRTREYIKRHLRDTDFFVSEFHLQGCRIRYRNIANGEIVEYEDKCLSRFLKIKKILEKERKIKN